MTAKNLAILIFDGVEVLDFAGPFEVFAVTQELNNHSLFNVFTISKSKEPITAVNGLSVNPKYGFANHPKIDILLIPGGAGTKLLVDDKKSLAWIKQNQSTAQFTLSVCSGARILAKLGLLNGKSYCTHQTVYSQMVKMVTDGKPQPNKRFVASSANIYTSGGIAAGIDLSLFMVAKLHGLATAESTAKYMEYPFSN